MGLDALFMMKVYWIYRVGYARDGCLYSLLARSSDKLPNKLN